MYELKVRNDIGYLFNYFNAKIGVEIGVCQGDFSKAILDKWTGDKLYLVDHWRPSDDLTEDFKLDHNAQLDHFAHTFMNTYFYFDRCCIIKETSTDAAKLFQDESLDFIYIDAAHDYKNIIADLKTWTPKVKKGGIVSGHDYFNGYNVLGDKIVCVFEVEKAVNEFFTGYKINSTKGSEHPDTLPTWWVIK